MNSKGIEAALEAQRRMRENGEQLERLSPREKAARNPSSLRAAINAKCFDCVGAENADGGYRRAVRECPARTCSLHPLRPWAGGGAASAD